MSSDKLFNLRISYTCSPLLNKKTIGSMFTDFDKFWICCRASKY